MSDAAATIRRRWVALWRWSHRALRVCKAAGAVAVGRARAGTLGVANAPTSAGPRRWPSAPLATAAVAGLAALVLSTDLLLGLWTAAGPAVAPSSSARTAPPAPVSATPFDAHALTVMPEPAAGPDSAAPAGLPADDAPSSPDRTPLATSRLPVVPAVPAELDDIARELNRRRAEILEMEAGLALRETALRAAEAGLAAQVDRLEAFQRQLEALVGEAEAEEEERLQQLVKMYESMRAKSAAAIFDRLELPVILAVARRMREARMAAILAAMDPNRARLVTSELARERELPRLD